MKKNKFYLTWMAAALLTMGGCSDEIDGGKNGNTPDAEESAYVNVSISSASIGQTKAGTNGPQGGEDGDGFLHGTDEENKISDVNIFLYPADNASTVDANIAKSDVTITGHGYATGNEIGEGTGHSDNNHHTAEANVRIKVEDGTLTEQDQYFNVLIVTNAGKSLENITTVAQLRDYLWNDKAWSGNDMTQSCTNFVMSTHMMDGFANKSIVALSKNNNTADKAAPTVAYVERLAARLDLKIKENYTIGNKQDQVVLSDIAIVNQLKGGSYLLKRVSTDVTGDNVNTKPALSTTDKNNDIYLGDEKWSNTDYNYVIDPWTRHKSGSIFNSNPYGNVETDGYYKDNTTLVNTNISLADLYTNHFGNQMTESSVQFTPYTNFPNAAQGAGTSVDINGYKRIAYTLENTADVDQQINGFSTGVLFKGTYTPEKIGNFDDTNGNISEIDFSADTHKSFYAKVTGGEKVLYTDLKSLLISSFGETAVTSDLLGKWFKTSSSEAIEVQSVTTAISSLTGALGLQFKDFVSGKITEAEESATTIASSAINYEAFIKTLEADIETDASKLAELYNIYYYEDCTCYYKYWIRHANNNEYPNRGIMEFAIVRNNLYQLDVTAINNLGDPLPFTPGKDDPNTPDEPDEEKYYIEVMIYVKDWVIRNNDNIILQ